MKQLTGILLDNLYDAQHLELLEIVDYIFVRDNITAHNIKLPVFSIHDLANFKGSLITTNLNNAEYAIKCNGEFEIVFIVWDLEWMRQPLPFVRTSKIYRSVNKLIARSVSHGLAIQNYSNRKIDGYTKHS